MRRKTICIKLQGHTTNEHDFKDVQYSSYLQNIQMPTYEKYMPMICLKFDEG